MATPVELVIRIIADASKAQQALGGLQTEGGKLRGFAQGASTAVLGVGLAAAGIGAVAIKSAEEAASVAAGLDQVFKSMGDTTGTAAADAKTYASELSALIGVDDEVIMAAQTQLATFAAVSDETARGAGIFDRATTAAADLAAAGFGSMDTNSIQLGKALQDPVKGLAALGKSGVTFTDAQKDMIASMVEAGETTKAQEVVLAAIEEQVGGTAAATATGSEKMGVAFGEVQEQIGTALLPAFSSIADTILQDVLPAIQPMLDFFSEHIDIILPLAGILLGIAAAIKLWSIAQGILNLVMAASPITWIIAGIVALIAIIVLLVKNWDKIIETVKRVWSAVVDTLANAWASISGWFGTLKDKVFGFFKTAATWLVDIGRKIITGLLDGLKAAWENVTVWVGGLAAKVIGFYADAGRWLFDIGKKIIGGLWDGLKDMWSNVTGWLGGLGDKIADLKGPPSRDARLLVGAGKMIMGGLQSGLESGWGGVASYLGSRSIAIDGALAGSARGGSSSAYTMNIYPRQADAQSVAWGFRRLELARGTR